MTLQNRLILTFCAAILLVAGAFYYAGQRQTAALGHALSQRLLRDQVALTQEAVQSAAHSLSVRLAASLPQGQSNRGSLINALGAAVAARPGLIAELRDSDGALLYASAGRGTPLLDRYSLSDLHQAGQGSGLWLSPQHGAIILSAKVWLTDVGAVTVLFAEPATQIFASLQASLGAEQLALRDLRGRNIWPEASAVEPSDLRHPSARLMDGAALLSSPVVGFDGRQVAQLSSRHSLPPLPSPLPWIALALIAAFAAILVIWRLLRPLNAALTHLCEGETHGPETQSLQQAVETAARNRRRVEEIQLQSKRRQLRQERLIRAEIRKLASGLDPAGRAEMLHLLDASEDQDSTRDELGLLATVLGHLSRRIDGQHQQLAGMIAELREALVTRARLAGLEQELSIASDVQLSMVPNAFPKVAAHRVAGKMIPAKEVGGDFFDFFELDAHRYALMIGDVSGKGVPAALFMAICRTLLRATARYERDPGLCVASVNDFLASENGQMLFVTLFFGIYDTRTGVLSYVNAGHNPPLLRRRDGTSMLLPLTGDMALAVMEDEVFSTAQLQLEPGDLLLTYTDGVTEATDPAQTLYGEARMIALVEAGREQGPEQLVETLLAALESFADGSDQADDITLLALQRL